ncbi:adenosylcobinamide-phosphate synthase CbiB [Variovorax sp. ZT4R33]|uniref:adenosylcobinamide-phosphate synthase CbiB n=1 Tax=Variovorax sp. ZT4R33 TaxID=3443743 RepID=UPI003F455230
MAMLTAWPALTTLAGALCIALLVDRAWGEPSARWHPVVWMGRWLAWVGRWAAPATGSRAARARGGPFVRGAIGWSVGALVVVAVSVLLQSALSRLPPWAALPLLGLLLKPLLAWRMLQGEVLAVEAALGTSLDAGRAQLARLVSRDVSALSETEVRESAIESLAENLNDSVVAPLFWFLLLGLPGAALYRFANTADAMWGYRGERGGRVWEWAGKWAARVDDGLSWLPARLTALLLIGLPLGGPSQGVQRVRWTALRREAARTPSPNSGWPMAAMAMRLGLCLRKPGVYTLHSAGGMPSPADVTRAATAGERVVVVFALAAAVGALLWDRV